MKSVQDIFDRLQEKKSQLRVLRKRFKEELGTVPEYQKLGEEAAKNRAKRKQYELSVKERGGTTFTRMDELALAVRQDQQMLSDIAFTAIMKGEAIDIKGEDRKRVEPVFRITFKQTKLDL